MTVSPCLDGELPLRVAVIHHAHLLGGATISLLTLLQQLDRSTKLQITVFCISEEMRAFFSERLQCAVEMYPDPLPNFGKVLIWGATPLDWGKLTAFVRDLFRVPGSIWRQKRLFRDLNVDVVHLNSSVLFTTAVAARLAKIPVVWHVREMLAGCRWLPRLMFVRRMIRKLSACVIAISPEEKACLGAEDDDNVLVVRNPVDLHKLDPGKLSRDECRREWGLSSTAKVIVSLGGSSPWKGTVELLDAMQHTDSDTYLLFAGRPFVDAGHVSKASRILLAAEDMLVALGIQRDRVIRYWARVQLAWARCPRNRVRFLGALEEIAPLLMAADVLVFAGRRPHNPRPVSEAWALRKPVVVFDVHGIREKVESGVDGVVVDDVSGRGLGCALRTLLAHPELMGRMGENGYRKAVQFCDETTNAKQILEVYQNVAVTQHHGRQANNSCGDASVVLARD